MAHSQHYDNWQLPGQWLKRTLEWSERSVTQIPGEIFICPQWRHNHTSSLLVYPSLSSFTPYVKPPDPQGQKFICDFASHFWVKNKSYLCCLVGVLSYWILNYRTAKRSSLRPNTGSNKNPALWSPIHVVLPMVPPVGLWCSFFCQ